MTLTELRTDTELERQIAADWLCEYGTEADWNALLDRYHADQDLRRRFGLWLFDNGRAEGEGYLALSACRRSPMCYLPLSDSACPYWSREAVHYNSGCKLPVDWYTLIELEGKHTVFCPLWRIRQDATRSEVEQAAAIAFLKLPPLRRAELLRGKLV